MKLFLCTSTSTSTSSDLENLTKKVAIHFDWQLMVSTWNNSKLPLSDLDLNCTFILIDACEASKFDSFLTWYRSRKFVKNELRRYLILVPKYIQNQALKVSVMTDVHYFETPKTKDELIDLIHHASGCGDAFLDLSLSAASCIYSHVIDFSAIVSITSTNGKIVYANDNFVRTSGYSKEELIGQNHRILKSGKHSDHFYLSIWKTISQGLPWKGYICNKSKDGSLYWVDSVIYPVKDITGKIRQYISVRYEVTDEVRLKEQLIESDQRFRLSHAYAKVGSWEWNIETDALFWSPEIHKLFGYERPELEVSYENFMFAIHPDDRELVQQRVNESIETGKDYSVEHRVIYPNGAVRWLSERGQVTRNEHGQPVKMLGVVADIHELKMAQESAIDAECLKSSFISTLSHEIRNPLNAISGYNHLISELSQRDDVIRYAQKVSMIVQHMSEILDDVNLNTKLELGNIVHQKDTVELSVLIEECKAILDANSSGIHFIEESLSGAVLADNKHLRQVVINLLSNAIKYNKKNGSVAITTEETVNTIKLLIKDTGQGISEKELQDVFQPYERLEWKNSEIDGLGLGLSICKLLTEGMNGRIGVESALGVGSTFWIELPKSQVVSEAELNEDVDRAKYRLPNRVLVLEDNEFNQEFMKEQLNILGVEVEVAGNGVDGLALLETKSFDVVMTDINMPVMGGVEFIKRLRRHSNIQLSLMPVIVITAENSGLVVEDESFSPDDVLLKPFSINELLQVLSSKCDTRYSPSDSAEQNRTQQEPLLNQEVMDRYLSKDSSKKSKLLNIYSKALGKDLQRFKLSFENNDLLTVQSIAHKFSSSSMSIGAETLSSLFKDIEKGIKAQQSVSELVQQVLEASALVLNEIEQLNTSPDSQGCSEFNDEEQTVGIPVATSKDTMRLLAVDDDMFSLTQLKECVSDLSSVDLVLESDSTKALSMLISEHFDVVIFDIDMPKIDGIQFVRLLSETYTGQSLVIFSGEKTLITPVSDLIGSYKMEYLGALNKPICRLDVSRVLNSYKHQNELSNADRASVSDHEIRHAIKDGRVNVLFQPQVSLTTKEVVCVEALSRLIGLNNQIIFPDEFIPKLEKLGLESTFALIVAEKAIEYLAFLKAKYLDIKVAINFSMQSLEDLSLPEMLREYCKQFQVSPKNVVIELTESALSSQPKLALEVLARLKLMNFCLSIDDFGTGYSSLDKLQKMPFEELKLDRSYVASARQDEVSMALLKSSLGLARELAMQTVAEGVETLEDLELMEKLGADLVQGYYFARPMCGSELLNWIESFKS